MRQLLPPTAAAAILSLDGLNLEMGTDQRKDQALQILHNEGDLS